MTITCKINILCTVGLSQYLISFLLSFIRNKFCLILLLNIMCLFSQIIQNEKIRFF